jgi:UDP-N-acetylglucosamine 1-carboxyvinyltransferase
MDSMLIQGGRRLQGRINISGAKNASLPILACSLLTEDNLILSNVPSVTDITTMRHLLENHGVTWQEDVAGVSLNAGHINNFTAPYDIVRKMRASFWVLAPLLARFGEAKVSLPGGCALGARQVDLHVAGLAAMGADIAIEDGYVIAKTMGRLKGVHFNFDKISVGATISLIMAACLADGETQLMNAAAEPEIVDMCHCLVKMGAEIEWIGTHHLKIIGKKKLHGAKHHVISDRIEAGTYMIGAVITKGDLELYGIDYNIVENLGLKLLDAGAHIEHSAGRVRISMNQELRSVNIDTRVYPGYSTDLQAQFMALMTLGNGTSVITENIFENRFMHVPELCRMGADISINGHTATVRGVRELKGAEVMASDLRASVSLVLAAMAATGETKIRRIYHLDRGYSHIEEKLGNCGAIIERISGDGV